MAAELVRDAGVAADDLLVEFGAGKGRLTNELARAARHVVAVELDPTLAASLRGRWTNVELVVADAVTAELPREPFRVVANLPFSRTNDLLHRLLDDPRTPLVRADVIVEWGVALKRALPWPSTVSSVLWGAFYECAVTRRLPRSAFEPPPSVDAGVLVFRRRGIPLVSATRADAYCAFVARGFRHGLGSLPCRTPHGAIARDLDPHQWAELFLANGDAAVGRATRRGR